MKEVLMEEMNWHEYKQALKEIDMVITPIEI